MYRNTTASAGSSSCSCSSSSSSPTSWSSYPSPPQQRCSIIPPQPEHTRVEDRRIPQQVSWRFEATRQRLKHAAEARQRQVEKKKQRRGEKQKERQRQTQRLVPGQRTRTTRKRSGLGHARRGEQTEAAGAGSQPGMADSEHWPRVDDAHGDFHPGLDFVDSPLFPELHAPPLSSTPPSSSSPPTAPDDCAATLLTSPFMTFPHVSPSFAYPHHHHLPGAYSTTTTATVARHCHWPSSYPAADLSFLPPSGYHHASSSHHGLDYYGAPPQHHRPSFGGFSSTSSDDAAALYSLSGSLDGGGGGGAVRTISPKQTRVRPTPSPSPPSPPPPMDTHHLGHLMGVDGESAVAASMFAEFFGQQEQNHHGQDGEADVGGLVWEQPDLLAGQQGYHKHGQGIYHSPRHALPTDRPSRSSSIQRHSYLPVLVSNDVPKEGSSSAAANQSRRRSKHSSSTTASSSATTAKRLPLLAPGPPSSTTTTITTSSSSTKHHHSHNHNHHSSSSHRHRSTTTTNHHHTHHTPSSSTSLPLPPDSPPPFPPLADDDKSARDQYLLDAKQAGLTYREIRARGNFAEAESTLRGRYRTLTKDKTARVRKPEWKERDLRLLEKAVRHYSKSEGPTHVKIPWKKVGEWISDNGGSYHFGNATCRKKWDEMVVSRRQQHQQQ